MSASRLVASRNAPVSRGKKYAAARANKVLAERNQAVVAVGAWVEGGQHFNEYPSALASLTEEIQAEKRRENEENLQRFQDEVRHRVARQAQVRKMRQQPTVNPLRQYQVWSHHVVSAGETLMCAAAAEHRVMESGSYESREGMRHGRLRLAACRMIHREEMKSDLPGGEWNISPNRHNAGSHMLRAEQEVEEEDGRLLTSHHECPLVRQKLSRPVLQESEKSRPDPGFQSDLSPPPRVLWPLTDPEEVKRQRQSQFLMHRRLCMNTEREQVKENKQHRKHLKRTAGIKAEKEQLRLEEERRLERVWQLAEARQKLEERELLILERLKLEEEESAAELQRRRKEEKRKSASRFIEALRAQVKERLSQEKLNELPPLCYCASSFWDSHPDACANNCVFHNNPKEYAKALHSTMLSLDLK